MLECGGGRRGAWVYRLRRVPARPAKARPGSLPGQRLTARLGWRGGACRVAERSGRGAGRDKADGAGLMGPASASVLCRG